MKNSQMKVSVIIPVYNAAKALSECLDSMLSQSLTALEVICVECSSTDDSLERLLAYADGDKRLRVICREQCEDSSARNEGLLAACGEYVCFVEAKDGLAPGALEALVRQADEMQLEMLGFGSYEPGQTPAGETAWPLEGVHCGAELFSGLCWRKAYHAQRLRFLYRRSFLVEKCLTFEENVRCEDELFVPLALLSAGKTACANRAYYALRDPKGLETPSAAAFRGCMTAYGGLMRRAFAQEMDSRTAHYLWQQIMRLRTRTFALYAALPEQERAGVAWTEDPAMQALFRMGWETKELKDALNKTEKKLKKAENCSVRGMAAKLYRAFLRMCRRK